MPAIIRCGMRARSATTALPPMSLPSASASRPGCFCTSSEASSSLRYTVSRLAFGTSMPMTLRPGTVAMRTAVTDRTARHVVGQPDHPGAADARAPVPARTASPPGRGGSPRCCPARRNPTARSPAAGRWPAAPPPTGRTRRAPARRCSRSSGGNRQPGVGQRQALLLRRLARRWAPACGRCAPTPPAARQIRRRRAGRTKQAAGSRRTTVPGAGASMPGVRAGTGSASRRRCPPGGRPHQQSGGAAPAGPGVARRAAGEPPGRAPLARRQAERPAASAQPPARRRAIHAATAPNGPSKPLPAPSAARASRQPMAPPGPAPGGPCDRLREEAASMAASIGSAPSSGSESAPPCCRARDASRSATPRPATRCPAAAPPRRSLAAACRPGPPRPCRRGCSACRSVAVFSDGSRGS